MRRSLVVIAVVSLSALVSAPALAASGDLDHTWSNDGRVATVVSGIASDAWDLAVQPDDRVVVVGEAGQSFPTAAWGVVRYKPGGALDPTFSGDGKLVTNWTPGDDEAFAVRVLKSGKLLIAGQAGQDIGIARYTAGGKLDATFGGGDGEVVTDLTSGQDAGWDIEFLSGGAFLVGAQAGTDFAVVRYSRNGTRDMSFGTNGMATAHFAENAFAREIAIQPNGRILETGYLFTGSEFSVALARFTAAGQPDATFGGGDGKVVALKHRGGEGWGIHVVAGGKILVGGYSQKEDQPTGPLDALLLRFTSAGELDSTFGGGDGMTFADLGDDADFVLAMRVLASGKVLLAGSAGDEAVVARLTSAGHLDTTFSGDGIAPAGFTGSAEFWGIGLTSTNRIVASGYQTKSPDPDKFATARFLP